MKIRFIGDVHGKIDEYLSIISTCDRSIQVGDFGAGFVDLPNLSSNHQFIRGNHDSPQVCRNHPNWIKDGTFENNIFFMGGAWSIDYALRTPGVSWWHDEELSYSDLNDMISKYEQCKPEIMVTHDGPFSIMKSMFPYMPRSSRTRHALQTMFDIHKPQIWIFGHWHENKHEVYDETNFICLDELNFIDYQLENIHE